MRYILVCLVVIFFINCKEKNKSILKKQNNDKGYVNELDSIVVFGDKLISDKNYIHELDNTTIENVNENSFPLERLKFNYSDSSTIKKSCFNNSIRLDIISTPTYIRSEDMGNLNVTISNEKYLKTYKNDKIIDSIIVYKEETTNYSSLIDYCFLDEKFNLWILEVFLPLEEESPINYWNKYKINTSNGKISLVKELIKQRYGNTLIIDSIVYAQVDSYLNVRSAPNSNGEIIAKAYPTDELMVLEVLEGWVKIALNGKEGYVSSEFVK